MWTTIWIDIYQDRLDLEQNMPRLVWESKGTHQKKQQKEKERKKKDETKPLHLELMHQEWANEQDYCK